MSSLPLLMILLFLLVAGTSLFLAALTPFFPDMMWLVDFFLNLMIFLSGVFFDLAILPMKLQNFLLYNPLAVIITQFRRVILSGKFPDWTALLYPLLISLLFLIVGGWLLHEFEKKYPRMT